VRERGRRHRRTGAAAGVSVCGKTGTAQRLFERGGEGGHKLKDNGWFVAFAPCEAPEVVVSVLWEGSGEHGGMNAPIAATS